MNVACSGLAISAKKEEWERLGGENMRLRNGMGRMWELFEQAPLLGSLIDPNRDSPDPLLTAHPHELRQLIKRALTAETASTDADKWEVRVAAKGLSDAAAILAATITLVVTNVPWRVRATQSEDLKTWCQSRFDAAKQDLATVMLLRWYQALPAHGTFAAVTPQNWTFLSRYKTMRQNLLRESSWRVFVKLGPQAFETISGEIVNAGLYVVSRSTPGSDHLFLGVDLSSQYPAIAKAHELMQGALSLWNQRTQLTNPSSRVVLGELGDSPLLGEIANAWQGIATSDYPRFGRVFWEIPTVRDGWIMQQSTVSEGTMYGGREHILFWQDGYGVINEVCQKGATFRGKEAWGLPGVAVSQMSSLASTLYTGDRFDNNVAVICPFMPEHVGPIWAYCSSTEFRDDVRQLDQKVNVTNATLNDLPFDLPRWQDEYRRLYPSGMSGAASLAPTQWVFPGHPRPSDAPLHVAVARLLGYRWPDQQPDALDAHADADGIVCIPALRGERPAADRLADLLAAAWGDVDAASSRVCSEATRLEGASTAGDVDAASSRVCSEATRLEGASTAGASTAGASTWHPQTLTDLLAAVGHTGTLEEWLRDAFFKQHCELFHHRPFVWHVWDGHREGFSALVNYHKLDHETLKALTWSYLGDWIRTQEIEARAGKSGAGDKLAKARVLQQRLAAILEGEAPLDIFVRWKPIEQQPIDWHPDLDDGVRLNIRPFLTVADVGQKGAGVLRWKPKRIKWGKDRGKNPPGSPWGEERYNDLHLTLAEKRAARGE